MAYIKGFSTTLGTPTTSSSSTLSKDIGGLKNLVLFDYNFAAISHDWTEVLAGTGTCTEYGNGFFKLNTTANADRACMYQTFSAGGAGIYHLANTSYTASNFQFQMMCRLHASVDEAKTAFGFVATGTDDRTAAEFAGLVVDTAKIQFVSKTGGVEEKTDVSAYTMSATAGYCNATYRIRYNRSGAAWECYINGVLAATHSTKVPTTVNHVTFCAYGDGAEDCDYNIGNVKGWVEV